MRILVTGLDLEQLEHRGIAVYTNNLIQALYELGHEVWLLTEHEGLTTQRRLRKTLPKNAVSLLERTTLMELLDVGGVRKDLLNRPSKGDKAKTLILGLFNRVLHKFYRSERHLLDILDHLFPRSNYHIRGRHLVGLPDDPESPYEHIGRLSYLKYLTGIVPAKNIFLNSMRLQARGKRRVITVYSKLFDILLTTCPLGISAKGFRVLQTIHDTIPIELFKHPDDPILFAHRLRNSGSSHIFVSQESRRRFDFFMQTEPSLSKDTIVIQPPSLFAKRYKEGGEATNLTISNPKDLRLPSGLAPFSYILFNSKVEYRKNLDFLVDAYLSSSLPADGISLVICGGLEQDDYTGSLRRRTLPYEQEKTSSKYTGDFSGRPKNVSGRIVFTGFVDDDTRDKLFLAAVALVSPSIIEGFGIPVLDAASIGLPAIASDIGSHREIRDMHDFKNYVHLRETRSLSAWINKLNEISLERADLNVGSVNQHLLEKAEVNMRLKRFARVRNMVWEKFKLSLDESIAAPQ